jgi:hypothetical protein
VSDETEGTVYVRMPASLKRQIEAAAESDVISANSWAMRCFENAWLNGPRVRYKSKPWQCGAAGMSGAGARLLAWPEV